MTAKFCLSAYNGAWRNNLGAQFSSLAKSIGASHKERYLRQVSSEKCSECCSSRSIAVYAKNGTVVNFLEPNIKFSQVAGQMSTRFYCTTISSAEDDVEDAKPKKVYLTKPKPRFKTRWQQKKAKPKLAAVRLGPNYELIGDTRLYELYQEYPQLEELDIDLVRAILAEGALYGFSPTKCVKIIARFPEFVDNYWNLLPSSAKIWRRIGVAEVDRVNMFAKYPELMTLPERHVVKAYGFLTLYFSKAELVNLIQNCPSVVVDSELVLAEKLDLLWKSYSHSTEAISKCEAAKKSAFYIKVRHEFLIRAGLFKPVPFHKFLKMQAEKDRRNVPMQRDRYFTPSFIVCSSPEKFLKDCTKNGFTLSELDVFETFYREEIERKSQEEVVADYDDWAVSEEEGKEDTAVEMSIETDVNYAHEKYYYAGSASVGFFNVKDGVDFYY